ncbi:MAG: hypothetical protein COT84_01010 [Chlamydiae bacterium CG10_big_fil_rev_8_21_14_0_10_35_9]|nr:MAG: hypothetical protein COT84_01010 [Chlamydiae bacterium CG10_big_fil_rev_8_21_14_0_10_35_9]
MSISFPLASSVSSDHLPASTSSKEENHSLQDKIYLHIQKGIFRLNSAKNPIVVTFASPESSEKPPKWVVKCTSDCGKLDRRVNHEALFTLISDKVEEVITDTLPDVGGIDLGQDAVCIYEGEDCDVITTNALQEADDEDLHEVAFYTYVNKEDEWNFDPESDISYTPSLEYKYDISPYGNLLREVYVSIYLQALQIPHLCPVEVVFNTHNMAALLFPKRSSDLLKVIENINSSFNLDNVYGLPLYQLKNTLWQIFEFLDGMEKEGFCLLDMKLENLLAYNHKLTKIEVTDFGFANSIGENVASKGTWGYYPPEMLFQRINEATSHMDMFSTGIALFVLLTGHDFHYFDGYQPKMKEGLTVKLQKELHQAYIIIHLGKSPVIDLNQKESAFLKLALNNMQKCYTRCIHEWIDNIPQKEKVTEEFKTFASFFKEEEKSFHDFMLGKLRNFTPLWQIERELKSNIIDYWIQFTKSPVTEKIKYYLKFLKIRSVTSFMKYNLLCKSSNDHEIDEVISLFLRMTHPDANKRVQASKALEESSLFQIRCTLQLPSDLEEDLVLRIRPVGSRKIFECSLNAENNLSELSLRGGGSFVVSIRSRTASLINGSFQETDHVLYKKFKQIDDQSILHVEHNSREKFAINIHPKIQE